MALNSRKYWETRYRDGGNSGAGSYGRLAEFKADFLNAFMEANGVRSHFDLGCGDCNQLTLLKSREYLGVDFSNTVLAQVRARFADRPECSFRHVSDLDPIDVKDMATSLDVIYHILEDDRFALHIQRLFTFGSRYVAIYASDWDEQPKSKHVRHRKFTRHIAEHHTDWRLVAHVPNRYPWDEADPKNTSWADFYVYAKGDEPCVIPAV